MKKRCTSIAFFDGDIGKSNLSFDIFIIKYNLIHLNLVSNNNCRSTASERREYETKISSGHGLSTLYERNGAYC